MSSTPSEIIKLHDRYKKRMIGCTMLQQEDLHAEYLRELSEVQWEVDFNDIRRNGEGFLLFGSVTVPGPWGFGSEDIFLQAELDKAVSRESLAKLKRGQRVRLAGMPHYFDGGDGGEHSRSFTIKPARLESGV